MWGLLHEAARKIIEVFPRTSFHLVKIFPPSILPSLTYIVFMWSSNHQMTLTILPRSLLCALPQTMPKADGKSWISISPTLRMWRLGNDKENNWRFSFLSGLDPPYSSSKNQFLFGEDISSLNVTLSHLSRIPVELESSDDLENTALVTSMRPPSNSL